MDCTPEIVELVAGQRWPVRAALSPAAAARERSDARPDAASVYAGLLSPAGRFNRRRPAACVDRHRHDRRVSLARRTTTFAPTSTYLPTRRCRTSTSFRTRIVRDRRRGMPAKVPGPSFASAARDCARSAPTSTDGSDDRKCGTVRPGLTIEDGTLVVTDNYLKVRIPPGLPRNRSRRREVEPRQRRRSSSSCTARPETRRLNDSDALGDSAMRALELRSLGLAPIACSTAARLPSMSPTAARRRDPRRFRDQLSACGPDVAAARACGPIPSPDDRRGSRRTD